jgi:indolepyruvate ferredoxin oxidoreductase beta subunit
MVVPVSVSSGSASYPGDAEARLRKTFPRLVYFDAVALATEAGNARASNVVVVGALATGLKLPKETWQAAIRESVKPKFVDLNLRAFEAGWNAKN